MNTTATSEILFVYGTLRKDVLHEMFHILAKYASFLGGATVRGCLYDLGTYPGMVLSDDPTKEVFGELYRVRRENWDEVIAVLDDYEGCGPKDAEPHEYNRSIVTAKTRDGLEQKVWAYLLARPVAELPIIPGGDYLAQRNG